MIMGLLSDYFKKESDDLRSIRGQLREELQCYDTDEPDQIHRVKKEINRINYVLVTRIEELNDVQKDLKQRLEAELSNEILYLERSARPDKKSRGGGQFVKIEIPFSRIDNQNWREQNRSKVVLYMVLRRYIVRGHNPKDPFHIFENYYQQNKLAVCIRQSTLAKMFGYKNGATGAIERMLGELESEGAFYREYVVDQNEKSKSGFRRRTVYVLGEYKQKNIDWFYESGSLLKDKGSE
jgi:hypothetical protein